MNPGEMNNMAISGERSGQIMRQKRGQSRLLTRKESPFTKRGLKQEVSPWSEVLLQSASDWQMEWDLWHATRDNMWGSLVTCWPLDWHILSLAGLILASDWSILASNRTLIGQDIMTPRVRAHVSQSNIAPLSVLIRNLDSRINVLINFYTWALSSETAAVR